ncbi:MAG TPA: bifunctional UDP-N-acetylglucosamine diphosphorylase/glucosamine-1-phosphate N-acetyltransferase GlmU [Nitrospirales bacterium]|nr:bifunctional UDP-N-acetylglucosamine diphosphorylase/glucosamine-1-phosphate N-acetyltransferase GlmU [Nitrospirales bacterium]
MTGLAVIVLAAGQGKRMKTTLPKVLHPVAGVPMLRYVLDVAQRLQPDVIIPVIGHGREQVREFLATQQHLPLTIVEQPEQRGTGDALMVTKSAVDDRIRTILILNGDVPLLTDETIKRLLSIQEHEQPSVTMLTASIPNPKGYGRVVRSEGNRVSKIVEEADASPEERKILEINAGTYVSTPSFLYSALGAIQPKNAQKEFYLTDTIEIAVAKGKGVAALLLDDPAEAHGVNSRADLANVEGVMRWRIRERIMAGGVTLVDPQSTYIDYAVEIGQDTVVYPHTALEGATTVGERCVIRSGVRIADSMLGCAVTILDSSVISDSHIRDEVVVGPFAHLRTGSVLEQKSKVGNFVEMKKTVLGRGSKASHLSYLGDSRIGRDVNIGAGTVTCNYDGTQKHETIIEDGTFVGSNTALVAPVKIGSGALIAAGSTITNDVSPDELGIARSKQVNKPAKGLKRKRKQVSS